MFNCRYKEEIYNLKNQIADLERTLQAERYERSQDRELLTAKLELSHYKSRNDMRQNMLEAEARANAAVEMIKRLDEYANNITAMAKKCAADSGIFAGELTEKLIELAAQLRPEKPEVKVVTVEGGKVEVNNDL